MNISQSIELAALSRQLEAHCGEVVLRDIDHGYASQFWLVAMSATQLEDWWRSQDTFDSNPDGVKDPLYEAFGETPPPHSTLIHPGTFLDADSSDAVDLWVAMADSHKHYSCVLCCDSDSHLRRPDGSYIFHRGYQESRKA
jgi:hypothetical protein